MEIELFFFFFYEERKEGRDQCYSQGEKYGQEVGLKNWRKSQGKSVINNLKYVNKSPV